MFRYSSHVLLLGRTVLPACVCSCVLLVSMKITNVSHFSELWSVLISSVFVMLQTGRTRCVMYSTEDLNCTDENVIFYHL